MDFILCNSIFFGLKDRQRISFESFISALIYKALFNPFNVEYINFKINAGSV